MKHMGSGGTGEKVGKMNQKDGLVTLPSNTDRDPGTAKEK